MAAKKVRGSEKLLARKAVAAKDLARLVAVTKMKGVKVVDWHILGQPAPEAITGILQVGAGRTAAVLAKLIAIRGIRPRFEVFPLGIPVPDVYSIRFRV